MSAVETPKYQVGDIVLIIGTEYGTIQDVQEDDHYRVAVRNRGVSLLHANHLQLALTNQQNVALSAKCAQYSVQFRPEDFAPWFNLPMGWVGGRIGPIEVGCSPEGDIHS